MKTNKIEWERFCDRAAAKMRGVLDGKVTLKESSDFFEKDKSISDPDLRRYVEYIIFEFGGSPGYYQEMIDLFQRHAAEEEMVEYVHSHRSPGVRVVMPIDITWLWRTPPNEAPAPRARRVRRIRWFVQLTLVLACGLSWVMLAYFGFTHPVFFILPWVLFGVAAMAMGFWRFYAPCPRCRWNLNMQKRKDTFPMMVMFIPSSCPNCGLDLEHSDGRNLAPR